MTSHDLAAMVAASMVLPLAAVCIYQHMQLRRIVDRTEEHSAELGRAVHENVLPRMVEHEQRLANLENHAWKQGAPSSNPAPPPPAPRRPRRRPATVTVEEVGDLVIDPEATKQKVDRARTDLIAMERELRERTTEPAPAPVEADAKMSSPASPAS